MELGSPARAAAEPESSLQGPARRVRLGLAGESVSRHAGAVGRAVRGAAGEAEGAAPIPLSAEKSAGMLTFKLAILSSRVEDKWFVAPSAIRERHSEDSWHYEV